MRRKWPYVCTLVLGLIAVVFGALCIKYEFMIEGAIIIVAALVLVVASFLLVRTDRVRHTRPEDVQAMTGDVECEVTGIAKVGDRHVAEVKAKACEHGVLLCEADATNTFMMYEDMTRLSDASANRIVLFDTVRSQTIRITSGDREAISQFGEVLAEHGVEMVEE